MKQEIKKLIVRWLNVISTMGIAIMIIVAAYIFCNIFVYSSFSVPSNSMSPSLIPGDKIFVDKIATGARIFDFRKAHRKEKFDIERMPGWRDFKRGDILVFNFPYIGSWDTIIMNWPVYYVKRCIAKPGDTVSIDDFKYIINGERIEQPERYINSQYLLPNDSIAKSQNQLGYMAFRKDTIDKWTIRDFGPLLIPYKGKKISMDILSVNRYKPLIEWETGKIVKVNNGKVYLGDEPISEYIFQNNYYFMAGDNIFDSQDSRYWGLLPEDFIVGRAKFIWWSEKDGKIRWDRILKPL